MSNIKNEIYEKPFNKERVRFFIFTILAVSAPFASIYIPWRPENIDLGNWFSRSGAAMVVLSLLAEANALKIFNIFHPSGFVDISFKDFEEKFNKWPALLNKIAFTLIAIGTLIWGYGDILFKNA